MKYFLLYWWARNVTAISDSGPPNVSEASQKRTQCLRCSRCCHPPMVIAEELGECKKQSFTTFATSYGEQGIKDANNLETGFGPR